MKTKTEKELEREIEEYRKKTKQLHEIVRGIVRQNTTEENMNELIGYINLAMLKAKLEGYRLAKEEFNKKVEEFCEEIKPIIENECRGTSANCYNLKKMIFKVKDKIFKDGN